MRYVLAILLLLSTPAMADNTPQGTTPSPDLGVASEKLAEANYTCASGENHDGIKVRDAQITAACAEAAALLKLLEAAGYCDDPENPRRDLCVPVQRGAPEPGCGAFTSELWDPGVRTATFDERGGLVIVDHGRRKEYPDTVSVGTGIPYRVARALDGTTVSLRFYWEALIIDMEVFEPYCGADAARPVVAFPDNRRVDRWADASYICLTGEDRGGTKVSPQQSDAACAETDAILEELGKDGYCRGTNGYDWVLCH